MTLSYVIDDNLAVVPSRIAAIRFLEPYYVPQGGAAGWRIEVLVTDKWTVLKDFGEDQFGAESIYKTLVEAL